MKNSPTAPTKKLTATNRLVAAIFSLFFCILVGPALGAPPSGTFDNYYITKQGNGEIYSNGQMQAAVTIHYELQDGLAVTDIELLQLYTRIPITSLGWNPSTTDNGFVHEIYSGRSSSSMRDDGQRRSPRMQNSGRSIGYEPYYLSTPSNSTIDVCFRLTANDGSSVDTCDNTSNDAYVSLRSIPPIVYSGRDFELLQKGYSSEEGQVLRVEGLYSKHQPFNVHGVSGVIEGSRIEVDTGLSSLMETQDSNSGSLGVEQVTGYLGSSDLDYFSYIDWDAQIRELDVGQMAHDNPVLKLVKIWTYGGMYAGDYFCEAASLNYPAYECVKYSAPGVLPGDVPATTIQPYLTEEVLSKVVKIVDIYGTEHSVKFVISGDTIIVEE